MSFTDSAKIVLESFNKSTMLAKMVFALAVLLIILMILNSGSSFKEGFTQTKAYVLKEGDQIFDNFYSNYYDILVSTNIKNDYEIGEIINKTGPDTQSIIVDIGCGTGDHIAQLAKAGFNATGIDKSVDMIEKVKQKYPEESKNFISGDALDTMLLPPESATHILCLYFTLYYIKDKRQFFQNCMHWLMPGGYLAIHLVNRDKFDPILPAGDPLAIISPQRYAKQRIMDTYVEFDKLRYKGMFEIFPNDLALYKEIFTNKDTGEVRENHHIFYMPEQKDILNMARDAGFIMIAQIDLIKVGYDFQYIYILQKPN